MRFTSLTRNLTAVLSAAAVCLAACPPEPANASADSRSREVFEECVDTLFRDIIGSSPVTLHYCYADAPAQYRSDAALLGSFSEDNAESLAILQKAKDTMAGISYYDLTREQKRLYTRLEDYLKLQLEYCSLPDYSPTLSPMGGLLSSLDTVVTEYYLLCEADVLDYLALLADIPHFLQELQKELDYQEAIGYPASSYSIRTALSKKDVMLSIDNHPYLEAFRANSAEAGLTDDQIADYTAGVRTVLTEQVIPAFRQFYEALETKSGAAPQSRGLSHFEQGCDYYALLVRDKTGTSMTPEQLMTYLTEKLEDDYTAMTRMLYQNPSAYSNLQTQTAPQSDPDEILRDLIKHASVSLPEISYPDYTLSYLPEALEIEHNLAYYLSPPIDHIERNVIRMNASEIGNDSLRLWTTLAHEGYPGHLYQTQYFMQNQYSYPLETIMDSLGASEGWAYYVERLSLDWAGLDSVSADLYFSDMILGITIISLVDIGVNYEGWGISEIKAFLEPYYGSVSTADCQDYLDICANDAGIYLPYSVGYYQTVDTLDAIRPYYSSEKELYRAYLDQGMMPFRMLNRYLCLDGSI